MPIKIHHGPPGSYKTSGAVQDDFIREIKTGRIVVTNVRGLNNSELIKEKLNVKDVELIYLDTESNQDDFIKMRTFWHWAPAGAFFLIDEVQRIWKKSDKDIGSLNYIEDRSRPETLEEALQMHRHYNWDFVFTCQSIEQLRPEIRLVAEMAYRHKNLAVVGVPFLKGKYTEIQHSPENKGTSSSHVYTINTKKIKSKTFSIYDSTTTGSVADTKTGRSVFRDSKMLFYLAVLFTTVGFLFYNHFSRPKIPPPHKPNLNQSSKPYRQNSQVSDEVRTVVANPVSNRETLTDNHPEWLIGDWFFTGYLKEDNHYIFYLTQYPKGFDEEDYYISHISSDLESLGLSINKYGVCLAKLVVKKYEKWIYCDKKYKPQIRNDRNVTKTAKKAII